jgi:hypothetical protein
MFTDKTKHDSIKYLFLLLEFLYLISVVYKVSNVNIKKFIYK